MIPLALIALALLLGLLTLAHRVARAQTSDAVGRSHNVILWIAVFVFAVFVLAIGVVEFLP